MIRKVLVIRAKFLKFKFLKLAKIYNLNLRLDYQKDNRKIIKTKRKICLNNLENDLIQQFFKNKLPNPKRIDLNSYLKQTFHIKLSQKAQY